MFWVWERCPVWKLLTPGSPRSLAIGHRVSQQEQHHGAQVGLLGSAIVWTPPLHCPVAKQAVGKALMPVGTIGHGLMGWDPV